jgi:hypothetical protein
MSSYTYVISKIDWKQPSPELPDTVTVELPSWLVCCDEDVPESEWLEIVNEKLQLRYGQEARDCSWRPEGADG